MLRVVIGVIGADCHSVGLTIMNYILEEKNIEVINIGVLSSPEEFINAAIETSAEAIWVSSLYGHAEIDARGLRQKCIEKGLDDILLYIGGNLSIGKQDWQEVEKRFLGMGFDRVYPPGSDVYKAVEDLYADTRRVIYATN